MPDIGEPNVILADGEQWKCDIEYPVAQKKNYSHELHNTSVSTKS